MRGLILGFMLLASSAWAGGGYKLVPISTTAYAATGTAQPITLTALFSGDTKAVAVLFSCEGASAFYWNVTAPLATAPTWFHYGALSQTPILLDNIDRHQWLWFKSAGSASTIVLTACEANSPGF
jgi:hypothetical protein